MSPLARSLLALAALLAAAEAQDRRCTHQTVGQRTDFPVHVPDEYIPYPGREVTTTDSCPAPLHEVGVDIVVCNNTPGDVYPAPVIEGPYLPDLSDFTVYPCSDPAGCTAQITEYCGY